jgi:DNA-binding NarL/FixJ family response regulator
MLLGEWQSDRLVVAGDVAVYRDLIAERLGARGVPIDSVGNAGLVVLCPDGDGVSEVELLASEPGRKVIVLGVSDNEALAYFEAGAVCVLPHDTPPDAVCDAVKRACCGQTTLTERQTALVFQRLRETRSAHPDVLECLTVREREVARLIAEDLRNKEIASRLFISTSTVKKHVNHILCKLGARGRREVAAGLR